MLALVVAALPGAEQLEAWSRPQAAASEPAGNCSVSTLTHHCHHHPCSSIVSWLQGSRRGVLRPLWPVLSALVVVAAWTARHGPCLQVVRCKPASAAVQPLAAQGLALVPEGLVLALVWVMVLVSLLLVLLVVYRRCCCCGQLRQSWLALVCGVVWPLSPSLTMMMTPTQVCCCHC